MSRETIMNAIAKERDAQLEKWGKQSLSLPEWITILSEEVGEASKEACDYHFANDLPTDPLSRDTIQSGRLLNFYHEMVQVAAVAVAILEDVGSGLEFNRTWRDMQKKQSSPVPEGSEGDSVEDPNVCEPRVCVVSYSHNIYDGQVRLMVDKDASRHEIFKAAMMLLSARLRLNPAFGISLRIVDDNHKEGK